MKTRKGFTFSELLISLIILSLTFQIVISIVYNSVESYKISRINIQNLYAENSISLLFSILENELRYTGSGGELIKNLYKPTYQEGDESSYVQKGEKYSQICDHIWLSNSIDYYEDTSKIEFLISYLVTYNNFFVRNSDGTYSPLYRGAIDEIKWVVIKNKISSSSEGYYTRIAKLYAKKISGTGTYPGIVTPDDKFIFEEINLANSSKRIALLSDDKYVYPIYKRKDLKFSGYPNNMFRQTKIVFEKESNKIYIERFFPTVFNSGTNIYKLDILENVENFQIYAIYFENGIKKEKSLKEIKNSNAFDLSSIYALKFVLKWKAPWKYKSQNLELIKTKIVVLIPNM